MLKNPLDLWIIYQPRSLTSADGLHPRDPPHPRWGFPFPSLSVAAYNFLCLASTASDASFSAFIAKLTPGRSPRDGDQHLEMKFQTSSDNHSLGPGGRAGRSPVTTWNISAPSLAPGKGFCPVITWMLR